MFHEKGSLARAYAMYLRMDDGGGEGIGMMDGEEEGVVVCKLCEVSKTKLISGENLNIFVFRVI